MSLDDKLREIIIDEGGDGSDYAIAQVKQAFADEGYLTPEQAIKVQELVNQMAETAVKAFQAPVIHYVVMSDDQKVATPVMTGQEWYDRFEKELYKISQTGNYVYSTAELDAFLAAAKKAAGL